MAKSSTTSSKKTTAKKKAAPKKNPADDTAKRKMATKKAAVKKKKAVKQASDKPGKPAAGKKTRHVTPAERRQLIAEAAYLRGESQGFLSDERDDWLQAESEVDALLAKAKVKIRD